MSLHEGLKRQSLGSFDPMAPGTEGRRGEEGTTSVYWFILVLGTGIMAPWNSWVLAYRYFDMVFNCQTNEEVGATLQTPTACPVTLPSG